MAWYNNSWGYRIKLTVDSTKVGSTQSNYPLYINLDDLPDSFFTHVKSDGTDIVVTSDDEVTKLDRELVSIDTSGKTGELYARISSLSNSANTVVYLYYGNSAGTETNTTNTWNVNYQGVYHCKNGEATVDSTSNGNNGSDTDTTNVTGQIGDARGYNGSSSKIAISSIAGIRSSALTIEAWIRPLTTATDKATLTQWDNASNNNWIFATGTVASSWSITGRYSGGDTRAMSTTGYSTASYQYVAGALDGGAVDLYVNGTLVATNTPSGALSTTTTSMVFGNKNAAVSEWFTGNIDEVRYSNADRLQGYFTTTYNNISSSSTFYSVGGEESLFGGLFALGSEI